MLAFCGRYCWINQYWWKNFRLFFLILTLYFSIRSSVSVLCCAVLCGAAAVFSSSFRLHSFRVLHTKDGWKSSYRTNKQMATFKTTNYFCTHHQNEYTKAVNEYGAKSKCYRVLLGRGEWYFCHVWQSMCVCLGLCLCVGCARFKRCFEFDCSGKFHSSSESW